MQSPIVVGDSITVRAIKAEDIDDLISFGLSDAAFSVSGEITFYERSELQEFIEDSNWELGIALVNSKIVGFLSVHRMSNHWAMLDNFYVSPPERGTGVSRFMYKWLLETTQTWNSSYLTSLVDVEDSTTAKLLIRQSWSPQKRYQWFDLNLRNI